MKNYKPHTNCRVCHSKNLIMYIDLGSLPLSNNLCNSREDEPERFPLQVLLCTECGLSQLSIVIDPNILFGHYVYRSSINEGYVEHCQKMAINLKKKYNLTEDSLVIDIAGNDGALLKEFKRELKCAVLNVDPAVNLTEIAVKEGVKSCNRFWSSDTAKHLLSTGQADLITATNVIAHVDDLYDFLSGIKLMLKPNGICIIEFPYLLDFIKNGEFDTIYFEHLSYLSIKPLSIACEVSGLSISLVEKIPIHGGSVRVHIQHSTIEEYITSESQLRVHDYFKFADKALITASRLHINLKTLKSYNQRVAAFAASAKGNTLLNCAKINSEIIDYIVDETPEKANKFSPGTKIPIVPIRVLKEDPPDYLVILSWNFAEEIMSKCISIGYKGDFIIPIPDFKLIKNNDNSRAENSNSSQQ